MNNTDADLYELQWNNHAKILKGTFDIFRNDNELVDVTLSCEGKKLKAHKIVLSACSAYFLDLFRDNPCQHPIIIMRDIKYEAMVNILNFMYMGEVNIAMEHLNSFLKTAESLQVKGLAMEISQGKSFMKPTKLNNSVKDVGKLKRNMESINSSSQKSPKILKTYQKNSDIIKNANETISLLKNKQSNESKGDTLQTGIQIENANTSELIEKSLIYLSKTDEETNNESSFNESDEPIQLDQLKTEIIDLDILTDDSIEYAALETNSQQEYTHYAEISGNYNESASVSTNKTYPCPHCKKIFNHYISLKLHLPRHSGDTSCTICNAVLGRKYDLKIHMRRKHNIDMDVYFKRSQPFVDLSPLTQS